ncbi:cupredoxin domain-containing protein [Sutcliffiella horikoshii]|uniref:cupredoxin domain-containing protein n=1 Tax=Sutcliffiella horikoshii TaxID=79883 RepID=UPI003CF8A242
MINSYTRFAATLLFLQIATIILTGLFLLRHFPVIHILNGVIALIVALLLFFIKWKWTPILGMLYGLLFSILTVPSYFISMFRHIDPEYNAMLEASNPFFGISTLTALLVLGILFFSTAGLVANLRQAQQPPAWFPKVRSAIYGATIMGLLISLYLQQHWVTGINATSMEKLPTIVMKPNSVEPEKIEVQAGEPLVFHIKNQSENKCHILQFPELSESVHMEQGRSGLIIIDPEPGTYTYGCKPHHGYMNENIKGTLIVKPR